jgi:hypothetical protein
MHGGARMTRGEREDAEIWLTLLFASLIVAACLAWIAPIVDSLAPNPKPGERAGATGAEPACGICGVIEEVRDFESTASRHGVSTATGGQAGLAMIILSAFGGELRFDPVRIYQVEVRMQDGSVRSLLSAIPPARKPGDRVKVVRGRIEPAS